MAAVNTSRVLTPSELEGFLWRNPGYNLPTWLWFDVPEQGHIVRDATLGPVLVSIDPSGAGHFHLVSGQFAAETEKPPFRSDPNYGEVFDDWAKAIPGAITNGIMLVGVGWLLLWYLEGRK